MALKRNAGL